MTLQPVILCAFVTAYLLIVAMIAFALSYQPRVSETGRRAGSAENDRTLDFWTLVGCGLFVVSGIGWFFGRTTYYNYLVIDILLLPLLAVLSFALLTALPFRASDPLDTEGCVRFVLVRTAWLAVLIALLVWVVSAMSDILPNHLHALWEGPQRGSGIVERVEQIKGRQLIGHLTIDGVVYQILDLSWWERLESGQRIDFLRDPDKTTVFQADRAALTPAGWLFAGCAAGVWLVTGGLLARRLRQIAAARR